MMTTRAEFMDSVDLIKNKIIELTQERDQLRQRIADLEAQLAEAKDGGWTYTEDKLPPEDTLLWVTEWYPLYGDYRMMKEMRYINGEWIDGSGFRHGRYIDKNGIEEGTYIIAWMLKPQPAPLRTADTEEQGA